MSISVQNLKFRYGVRPILDDISFEITKNELVALLGPNGVGKSTLFKCVLGLLKKYEGTIKLNEYDAKTIKEKELAKLIAYIPQSHSPVYNFSVFDMVLMGTTSQVSNISSPGPKQRELVMASLERMGITHLFNRSYNFISGGERQLVLISRALAQQAKILVMDEPTANLDYGNQMRVLDQIKSLSKEGYTIILSTHNPDQSYLFADRILALNGGKLIADGTPKDIITTELIRTLYNVDITVESLHDDNIRFCVPNSLIK